MRRAKLTTLIILLVIAALVIVQNWEPVKANLLFWSLQPPLAALLLGTLVVGYGLGLLTTALWKVRTWRTEALAARKLAVPEKLSTPEKTTAI